MSPAPAGGRGACGSDIHEGLGFEPGEGSDEANGFVSPANTWSPSVPWGTFGSADRGSRHTAVGAVFYMRISKGLAGVWACVRVCVCEALGGGVPH